jgi:hypothetical protein
MVALLADVPPFDAGIIHPKHRRREDERALLLPINEMSIHLSY